jgi:hypothetical protein
MDRYEIIIYWSAEDDAFVAEVRTLRVLADRPRRPCRFLVLGSASPELAGLLGERHSGPRSRVRHLDRGDGPHNGRHHCPVNPVILSFPGRSQFRGLKAAAGCQLPGRRASTCWRKDSG